MKKAHAIAVSLLALCAVAAPIASIVANAPETPRPALEAGLPVPVVPSPEPTEAPVSVQTLPEVRIVASARKAPSKPGKTWECRLRILEQGGRPGHRFVRYCD